MKLTPEEEVDRDYLLAGGRRTYEQVIAMLLVGRAPGSACEVRVSSLHGEASVGGSISWSAQLVGDGPPPEPLRRSLVDGTPIFLSDRLRQPR